MNVLVLGLGNILCSDEGVGVRVVETLGEHYNLPDSVELLDGGTSGMDLLDTIAGRDCLIVTDAMRSDAAPGTVIRLAGKEVQAFFRTRVSPHQIGLSEVLAVLRLSDETPAQVIIIGIVPESLKLGLDLTPAGARGRDDAVKMVVDELDRLGLPAVRRADMDVRLDELAARFRQIGEARMQDLPIYNAGLDVEAIGFQPLGEDWIGVLVTPWFMNAVLVPREKHPMDMALMGRQVSVDLPSGPRVFLWGGDETTGLFKSLSLHSPVLHFAAPEVARFEARRMINALMTPAKKEDAAIAQPPPGPAVSRRAFLRGGA